MLERGEALTARFALVRRLGAGGAGEVWLAEDRERACMVALKVLKPALADDVDAIAALEREWAQVRALDHPHILRLHGFYRSERGAFLSMEYAQGGDLSRLRGAPLAQVLRAAAQIAAALAYAHARGVVHRDVKPANVLLRADETPALADFGAALAASTAPTLHAGRGSPFSMSPQQLDGEPARAADDVYGLGALLYELLSGYPPFYPAGDAQRIRSERPAPLTSAPAAVERLIARMLAKSPDERPTMIEVERELRDALTAAPTPTMTTEEHSRHLEPPAVRAPSAQGEPLKPQWRRAEDADGVAPGRGERVRRGVGVAFAVLSVLGLGLVFFALPRWVGEQGVAKAPVAAAPAPTPEPQVEAAEDIDFAALARAKQEADEVRAPLVERLDKLTERAAEQWGGENFASARAELSAADAAYEKREYIQAVEHFTRMTPLIAALEERAGEVLNEQLKAGGAALEEGDAASAQAAFALALKIEPDNKDAASGLKRAGVLDRVRAILADARRAEESGEMNTALAGYRRALALDAQTASASEGVARVEARLAGDAFAAAMARGYEALAAQRHEDARAAFEAARKIRPNSPEIAPALRQIEQEQRTETIGRRLAAAQAHEAEEAWADALREYRAVVELDSTVAAGAEGVARTTPRAALNEQLELYLTQPERLFSAPVRAAAREHLAQARAVSDAGPVLQKQIATLTDWIERANAPVQVALQSDNVTQVTIYRVGELGSFAQRSLELAPGTYTVVGTRPGYRDVRRQIHVAPGALKEPVVIRCEDRI